MDTQGMIQRHTASMIVEHITEATDNVRLAFQLLHDTKERLGQVLGDGTRTQYNHLWSQNISDYDLPATSEQVTRQLEKNAWQYIIDLMGLQAYMTEKRQKELHEQLTSGKFPPLTVENIMSTFTGLVGQVDTLLKESAADVYRWLCPSDYWRPGALKTNKRWKVGHKAIIGGALEHEYGGGFRLNYYRDANWRALGNVFSLLDGAGAQHYPDDLVTQLKERLRHVHSGEMVHTPYVSVKPYGNGNAHLLFHRMDLVDKLNALCGDGSSLPDTE